MILMHKDIPVAEVTMISGSQIVAARVFNREHTPIGTLSDNPSMTVLKLRHWEETRAIPKERQGKERIERALGCSVSDAAIRSMGVSLTDCYWYKDERMTNLLWQDVNYYDNGFSQDVAAVVLYGSEAPIVDFKSPDLSTDGVLKKAWVSLDDVPSLVKFGDFGPNAAGKNLLSANEVAAYRIANMIGLPHAEYAVAQITGTGEKVCISPCFIHSSNEEFVTASQIAAEYHSSGKMLYDTFKNAGMQQQIDSMIVFDHIIHNTDRHEKNFGIIRNPETMEITRFAPLFDSGSSFGWNYDPNLIDMNETKPFYQDRLKQLQLVDLSGQIILPEEQVKEIVRNTYEEFELPERNFQIASEDIGKSYNMLNLLEKIYAQEEEWDR